MRRMMTVTGLAIMLAGCGSLSPARFVATGTGLVSHQLCSEVFVGGRDPKLAYSQAVAPLLGPLSGAVRWRIDRPTGLVEASAVGAGRQRAVYRGGLGCVRVDSDAAWAPAMATRTKIRTTTCQASVSPQQNSSSSSLGTMAPSFRP